MARGVIEELAYVLRAETEGLAGDLRGAEGHLNKFTAFVERNPLAAAGALGAALVTAGVAATKMALEVERGLHRIERVVPGATGKLGALRESIEAISKQSPRTQAALAQAADAIAAGGVESMEALDQRLKASVRAADASGADLGSVISGLDQVLDLFGASSADADTMLAKLFATAKGRFPIDDLLGALQGATPTIRAFGLDFDTATRALGALLEQGRTAKQAGSELKAYAELGADGAAAIRDLAAGHEIATTAVRDYEAAVATARDTVDANWQLTKNNFASVMIDLGQNILPVVAAELRGIVGLIDLMSGAASKVRSNARVATMQVGFSTSGRGVGADEFRTQARQLTRDARAGLLDLTGVSLEDLTRMQQNLDKLRAATGATRDEFFALYIAIENAMKRAATATGEAAAGADGTGTTGTGTSGTAKTPEQIKAEQDAAAAAAKAKAKVEAERERVREDFRRFTVELTTTLVDDIQQQFAPLIQAATEAGLVDIAKSYTAGMEQALAAQRVIEATDADVAGVRARQPENRIAQMAALLRGEKELRAEAERHAKGSATRVQLEAEITENLAEQNRLSNEARGYLDEIAAAEEKRGNAIAEGVRSIANAVAGTLQLANAFGIVDDNAARAVSSISAIANNISGAMGGDIGSILQVAGGVAQLIFGESPEAARRREVLQQNTDAIKELTKKAGQLGLDVSGSEASAALAALGRFLANDDVRFATSGPGGGMDARAIARAFGLDLKELDRIAKEHGITLDGSIESFNALQRAITETITKLGEFDTTVDSQKAQAEAAIDIFGITDPTKQLAIRQGATAGRSPALDAITAGLDLSTPEGRAEARRRAQATFGIMQAGGDQLTDTQLGGLSGDELLQAILDLIEGLNAIDAAAGTGAAGSTSGTITGFRSLTEATGNRIADYARAELDAVRQILALLQSWAAPALFPPTVSMPSLQGGPSTTITLSVQVTVNNYGAADVSGLGAVVADSARAGAEEALTYAGLIRESRRRGDLRIVQ